MGKSSKTKHVTVLKNSTRKIKSLFYNIGSGKERTTPSAKSEMRTSSARSERTMRPSATMERMRTSYARSERRKKTAEASRSAKSSKDSFLDVLHDMIYSDSLLPHCFTRTMKKHGITQTCDILQKYTIITFVLYKCIKNVYLLPHYINTITKLTQQGIHAKKIFPEQEDSSVKEFLSTRLSEEKNREVIYILSELNHLRYKMLDGRHIPLKPSESDVDENEWKTKINYILLKLEMALNLD
jgi:hypothetical protein